MSRELTAWVIVLNRIHELLAATVRTHPDVEAREALREALLVVERLEERMTEVDLRLAFAEMEAAGERG